ncbi:MAG: hypothetical protein II040_01365, partial [Muribaculaceae bacterium]|nr:hypothetical protein [Muribaculaceae bacterium]
TDSGKVFKEDVDIVPTIIDKSLSYIPWGSDNNMPYHIINLIESDETLATCQMFNAEVCYGSGLQYNTDSYGGKFVVLTRVPTFDSTHREDFDDILVVEGGV